MASRKIASAHPKVLLPNALAEFNKGPSNDSSNEHNARRAGRKENHKIITRPRSRTKLRK